jgi:hypothetical protein
MALFFLLTSTLLACAGSQPHRFVFDYSPPQALRMIREVLRDQGYRIAAFDESAGVVTTELREFEGQEGETVRYQIAVTIINPQELRIRVLPPAVLDYRDQIMETLLAPLEKVGLHPKYVPPPRSRPRSWRNPPAPPD